MEYQRLTVQPSISTNNNYSKLIWVCNPNLPSTDKQAVPANIVRQDKTITFVIMGTQGTTSYRIGDQNALHYITIATVKWVDIFTRRKYKNIIVESLAYCRMKKGLELYGYVIMTNHIHLICRAKEGFELSDILRDFKRHTAKYILNELQENQQESRKEWILGILQSVGETNQKNKTYQFWRQDNHPIELFKAETIKQKLEYIHNNPVEEGFVQKPEEYLYSSARNYAGLETILEIDKT